LKVRDLLYHLFWFGVIYCLLVANYWQLQKMFPQYLALMASSQNAPAAETEEVSSVAVNVIFANFDEKLSGELDSTELGKITFYRLPEGRTAFFSFDFEEQKHNMANVYVLSRQPLAGLRQFFLINGTPVKTEQIRFLAAQVIDVGCLADDHSGKNS